mgnify:CR=1 FL=1
MFINLMTWRKKGDQTDVTLSSSVIVIFNQTELLECEAFVIVHEILEIFKSQYFNYITPITDIFNLINMTKKIDQFIMIIVLAL